MGIISKVSFAVPVKLLPRDPNGDNVDSGYALAPSSNKPLPESILTQIYLYVAIGRHRATMSYIIYTGSAMVADDIAGQGATAWVLVYIRSLITTNSINSLWLSENKRGDGIGSTLAQVIACCLTAPNHYLDQYELMIFIRRQFTSDNSAIGH